MLKSAQLGFTFRCKPTVGEFRRSWQKTLGETRACLTKLERPRKDCELESYLPELNSLHLLGYLADARGEIWRNMHPDAQMRDEATDASKAFADLYSEIETSAAIAQNLARFEAAYPPLEEDSKRFVKIWKEDLQRKGAFLHPNEKARVRLLSSKIEETMNEFQDNITGDPTRLHLSVAELQGLPEDYLAHRTVDVSTNKLIISTKAADTSPILEYCEVQATREKVYRLVGAEASPANEDVLKRLLRLRHEKANLLGYVNHAALQLEDSMVKSPGEVAKFLEEVHDALKPLSDKEKSQISGLLKESKGIEAQAWDTSYGRTLLKSHLLSGFDLKFARQYFQVVTVFPALQRVAQKLFKLRFEEIEDMDAWHPTVTASNVYDLAGGEEVLIGRIFFDIYPREGKGDGAAAYTVRRPVTDVQLAEVILYANMPDQAGACMSYREVETILHELGHCVHALVAKQRYDRFAGLDTIPIDFLEAPSQMLEMWLTDAEVINFAVNHLGERIPDKLLHQLILADGIGRGMSKRALLAMSKYSLELYTRRPDDIADTTDIVAEVCKRYNNFDLVPGLSPHLSLFHLGMEAYASRLYSYLFSEVICHDIFSEFKKNGLKDEGIAARYRKIILEKGSSQDPEIFVHEFLGRKYNSRAFMDWLNTSDL